MARTRGKSHRSGKGGYEAWDRIRDYRAADDLREKRRANQAARRLKAKRSAAAKKGWVTRRCNESRKGTHNA